MTRSARTRTRAALEAVAGAAWIGAVAITAAGLFKTKKDPSSAAAPPPPPPRGAPPAPPPPRRASRGTRRWLTPIVTTAVIAAIGVPGATFGLGVLSGQAHEAPHFTAVSAGVETSRSAKGLMSFRRQVFEARPSPSPSPEPPPPPPEPEPEAVAAAPAPAPPPPAPAGSVVAIIHAAAARHGVSGDWMVSIAQCESGLNPRAVNPAGYYGLFQFSRSTWAAYGSGDIFDPAAQSEATASMLANGGSGHWPNCA